MRLADKIFPLTALVLATVSITPAKPSQEPELAEKFKAADFQVTRLAPSAFPELPAKIRRELERRGCTIPQVSEIKKPHNVIKGQFTDKGQTDLAVLCSVNRVSTILIFRNASAQHPFEIATEPDINKLAGGPAGNAIGYCRVIFPVGPKYIFSHYRAYGGPRPPPIDHQGINDTFAGKASVVRYFLAGHWIGLQGAD
jgi:hypothetical protein